MSVDHDVALAIERLADADPHAADAAGRVLLDKGAAVVPALVLAFHAAPAAIKRRLAFLLGELGRTAPAPRRAAIEGELTAALSDQDWKVRKNAAIALGKFAAAAAASALLARLRAEDDPRVRPSQILALGRLADPAQAAEVAAMEHATDAEASAARKVADRFREATGTGPTIDMSLPVADAITVELWCRAGIGEIVVAELAERGLAARLLAPDRVAVLSPAPLGDVAVVRSALYPVLTLEGAPPPSVRALGSAVCGSPFAAELHRLAGADQLYYRLQVDVPTAPFHRRRDWIAEFAAGCDGMVNAATGYAWELIVRAVAPRFMVGARPAAYADDRFAYRKLDVPASIHPTLAAAVVRLAPAGAQDVVLDPFCGSGTLLAERALRGPYRLLIGADVDANALSAAHENLGALERVTIERADILSSPDRGPVDAILTNPPYGQRVGSPQSARRLHAALDALAVRSLRPGGALVTLRPIGFPNPASLVVTQRLRVDAGGLTVDVVVARKPT